MTDHTTEKVQKSLVPLCPSCGEWNEGITHECRVLPPGVTSR